MDSAWLYNRPEMSDYGSGTRKKEGRREERGEERGEKGGKGRGKGGGMGVRRKGGRWWGGEREINRV